MKKLIFTLLFIVTAFISLPNVKALDYTYDIKYAGIRPGSTISIGANSEYIGDLYFEEPKTTYDDYLLVSYCATKNVTAWFDGHDTIHINTNDTCGVWGVAGTMQFAYFPLNNWTFTDTTAYYSTTNSRFQNFNSTEAYLTLYSVTTSSSVDVSMAILAYLQSQEKNIDYTDALTQIQQNQTIYKEEIGIVQDKLDETNTSINDMKDALTNGDVNNVEGSFENFESFIAENSTITQLITMPITLYTSILNGLQSTCQPFNLGNLFGTKLTIPCINIGNYLGTALWSTIDIIISGFAIYAISIKLIKIFNNFSSMKEGDVIDD